MAVLAPKNHPARIEAGDAVLAAAATADTRPVRAKLDAFRKRHEALRAETERLRVAEEATVAAEHALAEADVDQDAAIEPLALALVAVGQPRRAPFQGISKLPPSRVATLGYASEADALLTIAGKARKRKGATAALRSACGAAERAAKAVHGAAKKADRAHAAEAVARTRRDALTQPWETSFSALKRAVRVAEDDGARGLFAALFEATAPAKKPRAKKPAPTG
jgi:hypothetical protein